MTAFNKLNKINNRLISYGILVFILTVTLSGCFSEFGNIRANNDVIKLFEDRQSQSDYTFYFTGSEYGSNALMAIHKDYVLSPGSIELIWTEADRNDKYIHLRENGLAYPTFGYDMFDPSGKKIGIYYSFLDPGPVRMKENNQVVVYTPYGSGGYSDRR